MKRLFIALLCLGLTAFAAHAEPEAVLTFSSFDGGGHEYTVEIEDPSILACEVTRDYGPGDHELEEGAHYTAVCTFTGLRPGTTAVTVYGRSPIMENDDALYDAAVDEALNVTLTPRRALSTLFLYRSGEIYYNSYNIAREPDGYTVSVNDGDPQPIDAGAMDDLRRVVDQYDMESWDGFRESVPFVLDGESFWLEIRLTDGTHILARGDNAFPENYFPAISEMQAILDAAAPEAYD